MRAQLSDRPVKVGNPLDKLRGRLNRWLVLQESRQNVRILFPLRPQSVPAQVGAQPSSDFVRVTYPGTSSLHRGRQHCVIDKRDGSQISISLTRLQLPSQHLFTCLNISGITEFALVDNCPKQLLV